MKHIVLQPAKEENGGDGLEFRRRGIAGSSVMWQMVIYHQNLARSFDSRN